MSVLITGIVIYAIGAFLTALAIGFFRPNMDKDLAELIVYFWPLALIIIGVVILGDAIEDWANRNPSTSHKKPPEEDAESLVRHRNRATPLDKNPKRMLKYTPENKAYYEPHL